MHILKHQPWVENPTHADMGLEVQWNMWTTRQWPFNDLEDGDKVVCVSGGGPAKGVLMYETVVANLIRDRYEGHEGAWALMRTGLPRSVILEAGLTKRGFLNQAYTLAAPASGWLLAWFGTPTRWLGLPRPDGLRFRPNGWAKHEGPL